MTSDVPSFVMDYGYPDNPMEKPTVSYLDDDIVLFYFLREIQDREDGCDCILRLLFPAAVPLVFLDRPCKAFVESSSGEDLELCLMKTTSGQRLLQIFGMIFFFISKTVALCCSTSSTISSVIPALADAVFYQEFRPQLECIERYTMK